jgi:Protein of unknown function (DUF4019)
MIDQTRLAADIKVSWDRIDQGVIKMKSNWIMLVLLTIGVSAQAAIQAQQASEKAAQQAAESWLLLVDSAKYEESWEEAASVFKAAISKEDWKAAIQSARDPLGKNKSRKLKEAKYTKSLEGAPAGEYVVIQHESSFESQESITETIVMMLDKDSKWRVSGYFIR